MRIDSLVSEVCGCIVYVVRFTTLPVQNTASFLLLFKGMSRS